MIDMAAHVYYKIHLDIKRNRTSNNLFDQVFDIVYQWLQRKYTTRVAKWNKQQMKRYGDFRSDDLVVFAKTTSFIDQKRMINWACKIDEFEPAVPFDDAIDLIEKAPRIWTTEVGFEQKSVDSATISYVVYYMDKAGFIGTIDAAPSLNIPRIVRNILTSHSFDCYIGSDKMIIHPHSISIGQGKNFAEQVLYEKRSCPYLFIAPDEKEDGELIYPIEAKLLAENTMGNALVFTASSLSTLDEISYFIGEDHKCRRGQVMIYWPMLSSSEKKSWYLTAHQIESLGADATVQMLRRVFSTDIRYSDSREMFRIDDCNELYRRSRFIELQNKMSSYSQKAKETALSNADLVQQVSDAEELFKLSDSENQKHLARISSLESQIEEQKQENWRLQTQNAYFRSYQDEARGVKASLVNVRSIPTLPQTAYDVGLYFQQVFQDKIDFSEKGLRSLRSCSVRVDLLWECLYAIANQLTDLYRNNTPEIEHAFQTLTGWDMARGEGTQTRQNPKLMSLRKDVYQGRTIFIEPHVKKGTKETQPDFIRVYYCYDDTTKKIVIGHVGKHLDNFSSLSV